MSITEYKSIEETLDELYSTTDNDARERVNDLICILESEKRYLLDDIIGIEIEVEQIKQQREFSDEESEGYYDAFAEEYASSKVTLDDLEISIENFIANHADDDKYREVIKELKRILTDVQDLEKTLREDIEELKANYDL